MVKKWIVILSILILLIAACVSEYFYVNKTFEYLHRELVYFEEQIKQNEENIDTQENINYIKDLHEKWNKKVDGLKAVIWHTGTKDIEIGLGRIEVYVGENDFKEAMAELVSLIDYVEHYKDEFTITIENLL